MSDLGWRADGIERALAAGGVELEVYRRPGFQGGLGVRRVFGGGNASGFSVDAPYYQEDDEDPGFAPVYRKRARRRSRR